MQNTMCRDKYLALKTGLKNIENSLKIGKKLFANITRFQEFTHHDLLNISEPI